MSLAEYKMTIRRVIDELMKGNRDIVEKAFSPNFAFHSHTHIDPPLRGLEGARLMTSASDLAETQATIEDILEKETGSRYDARFAESTAARRNRVIPSRENAVLSWRSVPTASSRARSRMTGEYKRFGTAVRRGSDSESFSLHAPVNLPLALTLQETAKMILWSQPGPPGALGWLVSRRA